MKRTKASSVYSIPQHGFSSILTLWPQDTAFLRILWQHRRGFPSASCMYLCPFLLLQWYVLTRTQSISHLEGHSFSYEVPCIYAVKLTVCFQCLAHATISWVTCGLFPVACSTFPSSSFGPPFSHQHWFKSSHLPGEFSNYFLESFINICPSCKVGMCHHFRQFT